MPPTPAPPIDWDAYIDEALDLLCAYLRLDTSNPPGRERIACDFLGAILDREGIPYTLYDPGDDRLSLRAVLPGDGSARPFMLLNHTDVVPVDRSYWDVDPFEGLIKDGFVWGRGALDMKGLGIAQFMTFLTIKRLGLPLKRDLVFFAMADEEMSGTLGMRWIETNHPEALDAEYTINEGGGGISELFGVERPVFRIGLAEKTALRLRLVAEGRPGHGSIPNDDNALDRLIRAMQRIQNWKHPIVVSPLLAEFFGRLARSGIYRGESTAQALAEIAKQDPPLLALLSNTINATTFKSGIKDNVIPARAEATLDCRLLPGVDPAAFTAELAALIDDPRVIIEQARASERGASDANSFDTDLFRAIEDVIHEHIEEAVVVPAVGTGATDSAILRNRGMIAYGFGSGVNTPELAKTVHGHNERIAIENFRLSCELTFELTRRICT